MTPKSLLERLVAALRGLINEELKGVTTEARELPRRAPIVRRPPLSVERLDRFIEATQV